ncbi:MAG: 30S ribosomal protein S8 [Phycisphaerae bacterium]|nr:30S ribosomal protein S8 [Phycisphaerae bacterium]
MPTSDPIADMLTRIRNAVRARHAQVRVKRSHVCLGIAGVLQQEGYINSYDSIDDTAQGTIRVQLKYGETGEQILRDCQRVSRPGCRVYRGARQLPRVMDGLGISIVSTPLGVLSDRECRQRNVGGEVLCNVW